MHLSIDLAATITEALSQQPRHKQMAAGASSFEGLHLDEDLLEDLQLPGRDETFDDEERDESRSQCSTVGSEAVDSDALNEPPGAWQQMLDKYCMAQYSASPNYSIVSDRRGGRTAWSCVLSVAGHSFAARYWYDGQYIYNAREDAAEVALKSLDFHMPLTQQHGYYQPITTPASDKKDSERSARNPPSSSLKHSTSSPSIDSSSQSRRSQRTQRTYPSSSIDTLSKTGMKVVDFPGKWVHWCVDATKTRLHEICVEAQTGAKRGREFINELIDSYRRLRGVRWWLSLTDCAAVKVVKVGGTPGASKTKL